jgi:hypothetical protein
MVAAATDMDAADMATVAASDTDTAAADMPAELEDLPVEHAQPTVAGHGLA